MARRKVRTPNKGVELAIERAGSQVALAQKLKVRQPAINHWLFKNCPPERALQIEKEVGVPRALIRPDLFTEQ